MKYELRAATPYCTFEPPATARSWVVYAEGFGFPVAGYGVTPNEAQRNCQRYADELVRSVTYRVFRHRLWSER